MLAEDAIKAALSDYRIKQQAKSKENESNDSTPKETWFWCIPDDKLTSIV